MRYGIETTTRFRKQLKMMKKRGKNAQKVLDVIDMLADGRSLSEKYRDHQLTDSRRFQDCRECHIEPDWLLVYRRNEEKLVLLLIETGTHSDLFQK